jgi:hypothetical protein
MTSIFYRLRMALPVMGLFFLALGAAPVSHAAELIYDKGGASLFYADDSCSTFSVTGAGTASVTVTCGTGGGPDPITPSGCQLSAVGNTSLSSDGGAVTFNVSGCQGVTAGTTTYQLQRNSVSVGTVSMTASGLTYSENPNSSTTAVTSTYRARVCNGASCFTTNTVNVTVAGAQGGGETDFCNQYTGVSIIDRDVRGPLFEGSAGDGVLVMRFTVPVDRVPTVQLNVDGKTNSVIGWPTTATVSTSACDFRPVDPNGVNGPLIATSGMSVKLKLISFVRGQTYYLNIRNTDALGTKTCSGACPIRVGIM